MGLIQKGYFYLPTPLPVFPSRMLNKPMPLGSGQCGRGGREDGKRKELPFSEIRRLERSWKGEEKVLVFVVEMNREEKKNAAFLLNCANQ